MQVEFNSEALTAVHLVVQLHTVEDEEVVEAGVKEVVTD